MRTMHESVKNHSLASLVWLLASLLFPYNLK